MTDCCVEVFVGRMLAIRDASHLAHWAAKGAGSYAAHIALGEFYDGLLEKLDAYVEAYQGFYGLIQPVKPVPFTRENISAQILNEAKWLTDNCDAICKGNPALENMMQDISAHFATSYYKLRYLQ